LRSGLLVTSLDFRTAGDRPFQSTFRLFISVAPPVPVHPDVIDGYLHSRESNAAGRGAGHIGPLGAVDIESRMP